MLKMINKLAELEARAQKAADLLKSPYITDGQVEQVRKEIAWIKAEHKRLAKRAIKRAQRGY